MGEQTLLLYRGHAKQEWQISPSIFRQVPDIQRYENQIIRELISTFPEQFAADRSMFDRLVRMQHFGLPTRLLDMSRNPLVALYFACCEEPEEDGAIVVTDTPDHKTKFFDSDVVSCIANLANLTSNQTDSIEESKATTIADLAKLQAIDRLVQFIREEKPHFVSRIKKSDLFKPVAVIPKIANPRLNAQFGAFILFGLDQSEGVSYSKDSHVQNAIIPAKSKSSILDRLQSIGVTGSTLFPEIDRAATQIVSVYKNKVS